MSQFRPVQSIQQIDANGMIGEQDKEIPTTASLENTSPFHLFTDQHGAVTTGQLTDSFNSLPVTSTTGRIIRIPGSRNRTPTTEELPVPARRMSPRLRQGIILVTVLLVMITTLLSLAPLDNGQNALPFFKSISDWVHTQQANWEFQAHDTQVMQNNPAHDPSQQLPTPPPMILPNSQYVAIARQDAINVGISPDYFVRQINAESGFNPNAVSPAGAVGIAQFLPSTAAGLGFDPYDPIAALNGAAHLMASYSHNYGGDYAKALAAYNGGTGAVQNAINGCGQANWMNCLPGETRSYIRTIMGI
jgi:hypothetical protein